jgi:hypothetical protein
VDEKILGGCWAHWRTGRDELTIRTSGKLIALLAVYGMAFLCALLVYLSYRDSHVSRITVSTLSDLEKEFVVGNSGLRVRDPEFFKVCFAGNYVYALKDAQHWFAANDTEFMPALRTAGGRADVFNEQGNTSIVLLSHSSAVILQLEWRTFYVANYGCANVDAGDIELRKSKVTSGAELYLPNATLKAPRGPEQPRATLCEEKLQRFVQTIDELLAKKHAPDDYFRAAINRYLPPTGCTVEEVISISRTSRFFVPLREGAAQESFVYVVSFRNSDETVSFGLQKDAGNIEYPSVSPRIPSL